MSENVGESFWFLGLLIGETAPAPSSGLLLDCSMRETENIRASIVARHIKIHALAIDHGKVEVGNDELLAIVDGFHNVMSIRRDYRASSAFNPGLLYVMGQLGRNVGCPHHQPNRKHEASPFKGVVPACELCRFIH